MARSGRAGARSGCERRGARQAGVGGGGPSGGAGVWSQGAQRPEGSGAAAGGAWAPAAAQRAAFWARARVQGGRRGGRRLAGGVLKGQAPSGDAWAVNCLEWQRWSVV